MSVSPLSLQRTIMITVNTIGIKMDISRVFFFRWIWKLIK